jgi:hypothetical protein
MTDTVGASKYAISEQDDDKWKTLFYSKSSLRSPELPGRPTRKKTVVVHEAMHIVRKSMSVQPNEPSVSRRRRSRSRSLSPSVSKRRNPLTEVLFADMPPLADIKPLSGKRTLSLASQSTATTASLSSVGSAMGAPQKPQRHKSGTLSSYPNQATPTNTTASIDLSMIHSDAQSESDDVDSDEEGWLTLNDEKPKKLSQRMTRITSSYSDSEMSEASTIDSSGYNDTGRNRLKARRKEIKVKRALRIQDKLQKDREQETSENTQLDEDDSVIDTDQDLPTYQECELSERRKEKERGRRSSSKEGKRRSNSKNGPKSPKCRSMSGERRKNSPCESTPRRKGGRRAGKKEVTLTSPDRNDDIENTSKLAERKEEFVLSNSFTSGRRKVKQKSFDAPCDVPDFTMISPTPPHANIEGGGRRKAVKDRRSGSKNGFNLLLENSQKDSVPTVSPKPPQSPTPRSPRSRMSKNKKMEKKASSARTLGRVDDFKKQSPHTPKNGRSPSSDFDSPTKSPRKGKRPGPLRQPQSDRFLCASKNMDFAPQHSCRGLHVSENSSRAKRSTELRKHSKEDGVAFRKPAGCPFMEA